VLLLPNGVTTKVEFSAALQWAGTAPEAVDILNVSAGFYGLDQTFQPDLDVLMQVGVLPIFAIGNRPLTSCSPGNLRAGVSVGAVSEDGRLAPFSSRQSFHVEPYQWNVPQLVAPGDKVWVAAAAGGYRQRSGTSFAAPLVAGLAARLREVGGRMNAFTLQGQLLALCRPIPGVPALWQGAGRVL
jgi:hypothetical protein